MTAPDQHHRSWRVCGVQSLLYKFGRIDRLPMEHKADSHWNLVPAFIECWRQFYSARMIGEKIAVESTFTRSSKPHGLELQQDRDDIRYSRVHHDFKSLSDVRQGPADRLV